MDHITIGIVHEGKIPIDRRVPLTPEQAANSGLFKDTQKPADIWVENGEVKTLRPNGGMAYGLGAQILRDLGIRKMKLMSNAPVAYDGISNYGLEIVEQVPY